MKILKFLLFLCLFVFCGCSAYEFAKPDKPPYYWQLQEIYQGISLNRSNSADVLSVIRSSEHDFLSQSKSVIAACGEKRKTYHKWLNMVAFDENELTARRKYLVVINERPKLLFTEPWEGATFDCKMVIAKEVLDEPYADENARRIAVLEQVLENVHEDIDEVATDNKTLAVCGMVINQSLETVLVELESSPAFAARLSEPAGLDFNHISFDRGKIQMLIDGDIITIKMMLGSFTKFFQKRAE